MNRLRVLALCGLLAACGEPMTVPEDGGPSLGKAVPAPTVTSATPAEAPQAVTLDVHVFGSGFDQGSQADFQRNGVSDPKVRVNTTSYRSTTELVANVTIAADAQTVTYDVAVTTAKGKKGIGTELFLVTIPLEQLTAPTGVSMVNDVSPSGTMVGSISTTCGPGFAPALWNQSGQLTALPALSGTCGGVARSINASGVAVGSAYTGSTSSSVRWTPNGAGYSAELLPALPNGTDAGAWSINDLGWISAANTAAVWVPGSGWQLLTKPSGATSCLATFVSNTGQSAGRCIIAGVVNAVSWASPSAAPSVLPMPPGATGAYVRGINSSGMIVAHTTGTPNRAVKWTPSGTTWTVQTLADFGLGAAALGMNEAGYVVGSAVTKIRRSIPVFWDPSGVMRPLDSADGAGEALGISEPDGGLTIGGYALAKIAVRWRP
jgi:uncharacterized membrane protein